MQSRQKNKLARISKFAAQFDALRDSIEGDPSPDQIPELTAIIRDENAERDEQQCEWKPGQRGPWVIDFGECGD